MRCLIESPGKLYHFESSTYEGRKDGVECLEPKEEGRQGGAKFTVPLSREGSSLPRPLVPSFFWPFRTPTHPLARSPGQLSLKRFCGGMLQHQLGLLPRPKSHILFSPFHSLVCDRLLKTHRGHRTASRRGVRPSLFRVIGLM